MPIGIPFLAIELIKAAPRLVESGLKLHDTVGRRQPRHSAETAPEGDGVAAWRATVAELHERIDSLEDNERALGELVVQMARQHTQLVRWVMALTVVSLLTSVATITALVIAVVG